MRYNGFNTELCSYIESDYRTLSRVTIECVDYETFKKIVDVVKLILESEEKDNG